MRSKDPKDAALTVCTESGDLTVHRDGHVSGPGDHEQAAVAVLQAVADRWPIPAVADAPVLEILDEDDKRVFALHRDGIVESACPHPFYDALGRKSRDFHFA